MVQFIPDLAGHWYRRLRRNVKNSFLRLVYILFNCLWNSSRYPFIIWSSRGVNSSNWLNHRIILNLGRLWLSMNRLKSVFSSLNWRIISFLNKIGIWLFVLCSHWQHIWLCLFRLSFFLFGYFLFSARLIIHLHCRLANLLRLRLDLYLCFCCLRFFLLFNCLLFISLATFLIFWFYLLFSDLFLLCGSLFHFLRCLDFVLCRQFFVLLLL